MTTPEPITVAGRLFHRPVATGPAYWGPVTTTRSLLRARSPAVRIS